METLSYCQLMERMLAAEARVVELVAENVRIKEAIPQLKNIDYQNENMDDVALAEEIGFNAAVMAMHRWVPKTPVTDRIVAGIKAEGAEACVRALVTSDDDDFADAPNICAMVAYQLRESAK